MAGSPKDRDDDGLPPKFNIPSVDWNYVGGIVMGFILTFFFHFKFWQVLLVAFLWFFVVPVIIWNIRFTRDRRRRR